MLQDFKWGKWLLSVAMPTETEISSLLCMCVWQSEGLASVMQYGPMARQPWAYSYSLSWGKSPGQAFETHSIHHIYWGMIEMLQKHTGVSENLWHLTSYLLPNMTYLLRSLDVRWVNFKSKIKRKRDIYTICMAKMKLNVYDFVNHFAPIVTK